MKRTLEMLLITSMLSACTSGHRAITTTTEPQIAELVNYYLTNLKGDPEEQMLMQIYNNPLQGEYIEAAMNKGLAPIRIYSAIEVGLIQQREQLNIKKDEMRRAGIDESSDQFQQLLWSSFRISLFLSELTERGIAATKSDLARNNILPWYMERIGYSKK